MDDKLNVEETGLELNIEPQEETGVIFTPPIEEEGRVDELPVDETTPEEITEEDLDVKNYIKISPTLYIQMVEPDLVEGEELPEEELDLYKIFNPETGVVETRKLTDEEKKEIFVLELKRARIKFRNTTHDGNTTKTQFGSNYKQKRKKKNTLRKKSRKANR